jgi:hypothetical protein
MKPENWIPLGWLPIIDKEKTLRPNQGYEGGPARNCRLFQECWKIFLSNWAMFSTTHRLVIYADGIAREIMRFIAGLLGLLIILRTFTLLTLLLLSTVLRLLRIPITAHG